jgi:hypothetical protein
MYREVGLRVGMGVLTATRVSTVSLYSCENYFTYELV